MLAVELPRMLWLMDLPPRVEGPKWLAARLVPQYPEGARGI